MLLSYEVKRFIKFRWTFLISIAFAALLLYFVIKKIEITELTKIIQQGNSIWLIAALIILTISYSLRALRWRVLLSDIKNISPSTIFWGIHVGYLGNNILPARAGDVIRSILIGQKEKISKSYVLATTFIERLIDAVLLMLLALIIFSTLGGVASWLKNTVWYLLIFFISFIILFIILRPLLKPIWRRIHLMLPLPEKIKNKINNIIVQFYLGIKAFNKPQRIFSFLAYTLIIWAIDVLMAKSVGLAFGLNITPAQILLLLVGLGLSSSLPSTPGYIGIFQFVALTILMPFGFSADQALIFILAFQLVIYIETILWGSLGLWQLNKKGAYVE